MRKYTEHKITYWRSAIAFFLIILISFFLFSAYETVQRIFVQQQSIDIANDDLQLIANQAHAVDEWLSQFIRNLDTIISSYQNNNNIFVENPQVIDDARTYAVSNTRNLSKWWFSHYESFFQLLTDLYPHKQEIYALLGKHDDRNYLAILQNAGEKRPNGWFFGSFAFANVRHGFIQQLGVVDSYLPDFLAPETSVEAPKWALPMLDEDTIRFIASNKFGFTDLDGATIKQLYEVIFNQTYDKKKFQESEYSDLEKTLVGKKIDGILFLNTEMFEQSSPQITPLLQKRQFINANIDLIRGEDRSHKKEIYLDEVNEYFSNNSISLIANMVRNFETIKDNRLLNIYLPNASPWLKQVIEKNQLTTLYNPDYFYIWDTNHAFNKIDRFVDKEVIIYRDGKVVTHEFNKDIISHADLDKGAYTIHIYYHLNIDQSYHRYMKQLADQNQVTMTERELGILWLWPTYDNLYRANQSTIHLPYNRDIQNISGDISRSERFSSPFSKVINLRSEMTEPQSSNRISLEIIVN